MNALKIFNNQGVIPPVSEGNGASPNRSPYDVSIIDFVKLFAYTMDRIEILKGLLNYRQELYKLEITGFQWLDGSFVENVEELRQRPPADIDIMTFFATDKTNLDDPSWESNLEKLVDNKFTKPNFYVDGYLFPLEVQLDAEYLKSSGYWLSLFSHQRDTQIYKGFFIVKLDQELDKLASNYLNSLKLEGI